LLSAFAFSAVFAVEARPVDPLDLEKVNAYIEKELKEKGHDVLVKVTRGDLDDMAGPNGTEELITGGRTEFRWEEANPDPMEAGSGFMDLALYQDPSSGKSQVSAAAGFSLVLQNPREIYLQFEETVKNVIDNVNKNGFFCRAAMGGSWYIDIGLTDLGKLYAQYYRDDSDKPYRFTDLIKYKYSQPYNGFSGFDENAYNERLSDLFYEHFHAILKSHDDANAQP
jgi:hypothetical protein